MRLQTLGMPLWHNACSRELLQLSAAFPGLARAAAMVPPVFCVAELSLMMAESLSSRLAYCKASLKELVTDKLIALMPLEPPSPLHQRLSNPHQY